MRNGLYVKRESQYAVRTHVLPNVRWGGSRRSANDAGLRFSPLGQLCGTDLAVLSEGAGN